jgi:hypothetical protein
LCEEAPRQNAAESRKIPESGSVIPREGVERHHHPLVNAHPTPQPVIPREGVERQVYAADRQLDDYILSDF